MSHNRYTPLQIAVINAPLDQRVFVSGPSGAGKTTAGVGRLLALLAEGARADSILLLTPQRTIAAPYLEALVPAGETPAPLAGGTVSVMTVGGLAQRMVELFWPLVAEQAGFAYPDRPPTFLTLETAQYVMARLVRPLIEQGYFDGVAISRHRLYSQIIDNLNKAAVVGFPHTEISDRLKAAWVGETSQRYIYDDVQDCANRFRDFCLAHNLLDFSLQIEVFRKYLKPQPACRRYLMRVYRHLIVDNVEEDTPIAHDLIAEWLPDFTSALLIYDTEASYRRFLGADPVSGYRLSAACDDHFFFSESLVMPAGLEIFGAQIGAALHRIPGAPAEAEAEDNFTGARVENWLEHGERYFPKMVEWTANEVGRLVNEEDAPPGEIVILAPFLPDALRFLLTNRLQSLGIPSRSHRPSRALREEPAAQCLLTLSLLAHPHWGLSPSKFDVAYALLQAIAGLDLVRAQLLVEIVYRVSSQQHSLAPFERIRPEMQERITYLIGQRYDNLRAWLEEYSRQPVEELDIFLSRLFNEVLAQPGYGFHPYESDPPNYSAGEVAANLIESARKFRWGIAPLLAEDADASADESHEKQKSPGQEYIAMVQDGIVAAQYIQSWQNDPAEAVLLAPAYTFLMRNHPATYQFWLDVGSSGWFERLYQPLTHPYVLSRQWPEQIVWSDADEIEMNREALYRLSLGLLRRCRGKVYLATSDLNEQGYEQKGPLLKVLQRVLRRSARQSPEAFFWESDEEGL